MGVLPSHHGKQSWRCSSFSLPALRSSTLGYIESRPRHSGIGSARLSWLPLCWEVVRSVLYKECDSGLLGDIFKLQGCAQGLAGSGCQFAAGREHRSCVNCKPRTFFYEQYQSNRPVRIMSWPRCLSEKPCFPFPVRTWAASCATSLSSCQCLPCNPIFSKSLTPNATGANL